MIFEHILPQLRQGLPARRTGLSTFKWIRLIVPQEERGVDGPVSVWRIFKDKQLIAALGVFETDKDAKSALAEVRKAHTQKWTAYHKAKADFDEEAADPMRDTDLLSPIAPGLHKDYYKSCETRERPASHRNRLNEPFFISMLADGTIVPWQPSSTDLLSQDWNAA